VTPCLCFTLKDIKMSADKRRMKMKVASVYLLKRKNPRILINL
jgi:hypothetical protein